MKKRYRYINREISWLHFNERVLQEAQDQQTPLIERLKFLGIFSNNRDEFFRVRVASLKRLISINEKGLINNDSPQKILNKINSIVKKQEEKFTNTFFQLREDLKKEGIYIISESDLSDQQGEFVKSYFKKEVQPYLFPIMLNNFKNILSIKDGSFYLAVVLKPKNGKDDYALIKIPSKSTSRFVQLPKQVNKYYIILLDDVIRYCLQDIFSIFGYEKSKAYTIKITRDAELDIDNDISRSFMELMRDSLIQRKKGAPVRFVYDKKIPDDLLEKIMKKLKISQKDNLRSGGRYHNFKDFMNFPKFGYSDLRFPKFPPLSHKGLRDDESMLDILLEKDLLFHFPYQSFESTIDLLRQASIDPKVSEIKMTFYRAARYSNVVNALVNAARNGKKVKVFLEIKARFDEEANINLSKKFQNEGVRIIPSIPNYKVHAKLISITRINGEETQYFANISTGNFNESTAKVYADVSLFTSHPEIGKEVYDVFNLFEERYKQPNFKHLIVAPFHIRNFFLRQLDNEIQKASEGKDAWVILKLNSLVDKQIVRKLYQASNAGVKIKLIVRGICTLIPGVKNMSENIEVISIIDRFLEHSRILVFCNGGDLNYYIGSADWMPRNFDYRIEVMTPVYDKDIKSELWDILQIQLADNCKARITINEKENLYKKDNSNKKHRAQFELYKYYKNKHGV